MGFGHIYTINENNLTREVYEANVLGKNSKGRPRKPGTTGEGGVKKRGIHWPDVKRISNERVEWRSKCKEAVLVSQDAM